MNMITKSITNELANWEIPEEIYQESCKVRCRTLIFKIENYKKEEDLETEW